MTRTGVVIGATGGIGSACAVALAGAAERVVLIGRDEGRLLDVAAAVGEVASVVRADLATGSGRSAILDALREASVEVAWLVMASGRPLRGRLAEQEESEIVDTLLCNLVGPALLLRGLAGLTWAPSASIVVIGSVSATRAIAERAIYAASKAGLEHLAMSLAAEWAPRGIRVTVVAPGIIPTPFLGGDRDRLEAWAAEHVPAARTGTPDEVAEVVRWLCTDAPDYVVGARITVDGGMETVA